MHCYRKITEDLTWVGTNDRRLAMFEGVYAVPDGVSYNSYLLTDEKTVLFDTVDKAVIRRFLENVEAVLAGRSLDYLVIHHMEPDHSAAVSDILLHYPEVTLVCNAQTENMLRQFSALPDQTPTVLVKEGDILSTGKHELQFFMAPMVHWPEVMVTYDRTGRTLFSADAFGTFGALNGAIFADEVDFEKYYMDEARRYYTNIVGKYGMQVQALLKKASALDIQLLCPLHGFVWRKDLSVYIEKYALWSSYTPEIKGVMLAYASIYGNTEDAADILACRLREKGIPTVMFDVSVTAASEIISAAFQYSHLVFAAPTYNSGTFVSMEALLSDLASHNIQNRTVALMENGSWAPTSGKAMRAQLEKCKNMTILEPVITIRSTLKEEQLKEVDKLAAKLAESVLA